MPKFLVSEVKVAEVEAFNKADAIQQYESRMYGNYSVDVEAEELEDERPERQVIDTPLYQRSLLDTPGYMESLRQANEELSQEVDQFRVRVFTVNQNGEVSEVA